MKHAVDEVRRFLELLTVLFLALKLTGAVSWPWWWVIAPVWAPMLLAAVAAVFLFAKSRTP